MYVRYNVHYLVHPGLRWGLGMNYCGVAAASYLWVLGKGMQKQGTYWISKML